MQDGSSARELLRASATDADAVRQYLQSVEAAELNGLLDGIAPRRHKGKNPRAFLVQDDWLPLVHLLVQCETTRLRAACRIVRELRRGAPSELESMQLLTEISAGYAAALDELQEARERQSAQQLSRRRRQLLDEIHAVLDVVFSFLQDVVGDAKPDAKVLPQLLGLVPYFVGMSRELSEDTSEHLAKLLELPWSCVTVPSLLDVLVDDTSLMSRESWQQLQENVECMVTTSPELASETMNPVIRECVLVANVTSDHKWIGIARYLLRQLPVHLRQEAEFNLQMSFNQSPRIVSLVCESIRSSNCSLEADVDIRDTGNPFEDPPMSNGLSLALDWRDLFLLLHSLQASKPILHHRTSSSRIATEAAVFTDIEQLAWSIIQSDIRTIINSNGVGLRTASTTIEKRVLDQVELLLNFGGKQIHAREWKALLLMDIAFFWIEKNDTGVGDTNASASKPALALSILQAIFEMAPETRSEVLSCLFERCQRPTQKKIAGKTLSQLFISQSGRIFPHLNAIQDWLSMQFQRCFDSARDFFLIASRLATVYKDLYNFLMVFLRKLLSSGNKLHQQFAIDMWCTWLDHRISFSEQQEEEIVSALKNSVAACHDIQAWSFGRLEQAFQRNGPQTISPGISLRKSSWEELYRFLSQEAGKFVQPTPSSITGYQNGDGDDSGDEYDEEDSSLLQFRFSSLDAFYQQNASLDGAASTGLIFQKLLSCMIAFEEAASRLKVSSDGLAVESLNENNRDIKQWLVDMASNWKYFFHWVCQDADDLLSPSVQSKICEKSAWWKLVARVYIGCAICNVVIEILMRRRVVDSTEDTEQALMAFHADDSGLSVWSLMEVEFSLHRMIQKLAIHYSNEMEASISKEYVRAASYGLRRVLQPGKLQILSAIKAALQDTAATRVSQSDRPIGMSFDGVIFSLDSCCSPLQEDDIYGSFPYWDNEDSGALTILETMFSIYLTIRERILTLSGHSSNDDSRNINSFASNGSETDYRLQFSVYADSISAKFPALARHLVTPGRGTKSIVLLDAKSGEELLEHICSAIGRTLEMMIKATDLQSVDTQLGNALRNISWPNDSQQSNSGRGETCSNFVHLSRYFLSDVKKCVQLDRFTRLSVSCASLSKRLRDVGAELVDWSTNSSDGHTLSSLAYDVLCDNVVYNPRLLRLLSSICLPTYFSSRLDTFVAMESKIEGIIQACGLDSSVYTSSPKVLTRERPSHVLTIKKKKHKDKTPAHRKRLRHGFDARSSYGLRVDSDSDSDASYSSDSSISDSDDSRANVESNTNGGKLIQYVSPSRDRIPHLQSHATQSIAILAVLAVLEQSQSTLLKTIAGKNSNNEPHMFPHHQEIMGYIRIHELVIKAICNNRDFSWGTRKVLVKILHIIELGLRIGKASGAVQKGDDLDTSLRNETTFCILESSVLCAVRSRTWVDSLKDASHDSGTKSKVSATLLKMDVFFLQVPGTVQAWLKETMLSDALKDRLKALVTVVKEKMAPTDDKSARRGKAKPRQRLLGVVPIVRKRRKRLRSRHPIIDAFLNEEDGADAFADLEDFIE